MTKKTQSQIAAALSAAVSTATPHETTLGTFMFARPTITVNKTAGTIAGCAVMTAGWTKPPAVGKQFRIDATTLEQARDSINAQADGVKVRFKHPVVNGQPADDIGSVVGRLCNARIDGDVLRGDVKLGEYAAVMPGAGDLRSYLLGIADEDPTALGLSAMMRHTLDLIDGDPVARVMGVMGVDFVGNPAANWNGLLSVASAKEPQKQAAAALASDQLKSPATPDGKGFNMNPKLKKLLVALGLDSKANDEQANVWLSALSADKQAELKADAEKPDAPAKQPEQDVVALETKRVGDITALGTLLKVPEAKTREIIATGVKVEDARVALLAAAAEAAKPVSPGISVGEDQARVAMLSAIPEAIALRAGVAKIDKPGELSNKMRNLRLIDMGKQYLAAMGVSRSELDYMSDNAMASVMLNPRELISRFPRFAALAEATGDFTNLLRDAINKTLGPLYRDAPKTWPVWAKRNTARDFKNIYRARVSEVPSLQARRTGGTLNYVSISDTGETYYLSEYNSAIRLERKAIINDNLDAFGTLPQLQANSCWRGEEEAVYGVLTANAAMADTGTLFNTTAVTTTGGHANQVTGTAYLGAPSVATIGAAEKLMLVQKGPKGASRLGLSPKFIITPAALKVSTMAFLTSENLIAVISSTSTAPVTTGQRNPYAGRLTHVWSPVLDDTSATGFYLASDYRDGQIDTVEISFLEGEPEPVLRQETDFDSEDVKFAVRHTFAAKALDFRGLVYNPGA